MIAEYRRPDTLSEALELLADPNTIPLGGGTFINSPEFARQHGSVHLTVVDLQALGWNQIHQRGNTLAIDACVTLQELLEAQDIPSGLRRALRQENPLNIRNAATVAGTLVACEGRSSFATAMLALDAKLVILPADEEVALGDLLPLRESMMGGKLITGITIPLDLQHAFEYVARTPADRPIVCASLARWTSGRTRLALGGYGPAPLLALDGSSADDLKVAARNAYHEAADEWASAEYRSEVAGILAVRCREG